MKKQTCAAPKKTSGENDEEKKTNILETRKSFEKETYYE